MQIDDAHRKMAADGGCRGLSPFAHTFPMVPLALLVCFACLRLQKVGRNAESGPGTLALNCWDR